MNRTRYIFFSVILFLIGAGVLSCKKEVANSDSSNPNVLPPLTHEGKNTFGCKVNGEVWVAYAPFTVGGAISLEGAYYSDVKGFYLRSTRKHNELNIFENIDFAIVDIDATGVYQIYSNHHSTKGFIDYKSNFNCSNYYYDTTLVRTVNITYFSLVEGIVSGTFEMDLINPSCSGDTIRIREGRFDWRMTVY